MFGHLPRPVSDYKDSSANLKIINELLAITGLESKPEASIQVILNFFVQKLDCTAVFLFTPVQKNSFILFDYNSLRQIKSVDFNDIFFEGLIYKAYITKKSILVDEILKKNITKKETTLYPFLGESCIFIPLLDKGKTIGIIQFVFKKTDIIHKKKILKIVSSILKNHLLCLMLKDDLFKTVKKKSRNTGLNFNNIKSREIVDAVKGAVVLINLEGIIVSLNKYAKIVLKNDENMNGRHIHELIPIPLFSKDEIEEIYTADSRDDLNIFYNLNYNGEKVVFDIKWAGVFNENNKKTAVLLTIIECKKRKLKEEEIERAEQMAALGELSAGIAHEIKNPLTAIKGFTQLLMHRLDDKEFLTKFVKIISNEVMRLDDITERLLVFARPDSSGFEDVYITDIIEDTLLLVQYQFEQSGVKIYFEYNDNIPALIGNAARLAQVFLNIMLNALQSMKNGGNLVINVKFNHADDINEESVCIDFIDKGKGIAKQDINRVFNPFFTTKDKGTGLGMSITYRIVKEHGGDIIINSVSGKGTTVKVILPVLRRSIE